MILQPIDYVVYSWLIVAVVSAAYVAFDQFRSNPEPAVRKWGFGRGRNSARLPR